MRELTSKERMECFYSEGEIDRVPLLSCATMYAGWHNGLSSREFYFDIPKAFHAQEMLYLKEGFDDTPCYDLPHGEVLDLGGDLTIPESKLVELPYMKRFVINSVEDAWNYQLPPMEKRLFTQYRIDFLRYAFAHGIDSYSISAGSPFTMVGSMVETNTFMRWLVKEPETVKHLIKIAIMYLCETADRFIDEFGIEKCSVSSNYPFESNQLISKKVFEKYAYPAMMEIHENFRKKGLNNFGIHLCGNQNKNLEYFKDLNLHDRSFISSDEANNLQYVAAVLGKDNIYAGNVSTKLLVQGQPEDVYRQAENVIQTMKYNEGGFILMPSCDLPINTKPCNLSAMLKAACDFGKY